MNSAKGSSEEIQDLWGCSLISAFSIKELREKRLKSTLENLVPHADPWHRLVCCSDCNGKNTVQRMNSFALSNFIPKRGLSYGFPESFITENPPDYILDIFEEDKGETVYETTLMKPTTEVDESNKPDKDLRGVMVYQFDTKRKPKNK